MTASHEDTMLSAQSNESLDLMFEESDETTAKDANVIARCRALFRSFGERVSSFDLSRQIYG